MPPRWRQGGPKSSNPLIMWLVFQTKQLPSWSFLEAHIRSHLVSISATLLLLGIPGSLGPPGIKTKCVFFIIPQKFSLCGCQGSSLFRSPSKGLAVSSIVNWQPSCHPFGCITSFLLRAHLFCTLPASGRAFQGTHASPILTHVGLLFGQLLPEDSPWIYLRFPQNSVAVYGSSFSILLPFFLLVFSRLSLPTAASFPFILHWHPPCTSLQV